MQQLTYRGVRYHLRHQSVETAQTSFEGQFLGARYRMTTSQGNLQKRIPQQLSYRCVKYTA